MPKKKKCKHCLYGCQGTTGYFENVRIRSMRLEHYIALEILSLRLKFLVCERMNR